MVGAAMRVGRNVILDDVQLSAIAAEVRWTYEFRRGRGTAPGLLIHAFSRVRGVSGAEGMDDSLVLTLPALNAMGVARQMVPLITNGHERRAGSMFTLTTFRHYASSTAMQVARLPYLLLVIALCLFGVFVCIAWLRCSFPLFQRLTQRRRRVAASVIIRQRDKRQRHQ